MKLSLSRALPKIVVLVAMFVAPGGSRALAEDTFPNTETSPISVTEPHPALIIGNENQKSTDENGEAETQKVLRAYLQLQEQMHSAIVAIEKNRQETSLAALRNSEGIRERLQAIEQGLTHQRSEQLAAAESSNRLVLILSSIFAGLGFMAVVLASWMQLRAMGRLAEVAAAFPAAHALPVPRLAGNLEIGEVAPSAEAQQSAERLRQLLQSLEIRVKELEATAADQFTAQHGGGNPRDEKALLEHQSASEKPSRIAVLLGKGQALLHLNEAERAVEAFDEVLALDPHHTEALVKKGTALERLRRPEDAIACYDRAIAANDSMTLAYLYKGGVYNQLERFNEALECYEQALRTQQKGEHASSNAS